MQSQAISLRTSLDTHTPICSLTSNTQLHENNTCSADNTCGTKIKLWLDKTMLFFTIHMQKDSTGLFIKIIVTQI